MWCFVQLRIRSYNCAAVTVTPDAPLAAAAAGGQKQYRLNPNNHK